MNETWFRQYFWLLVFGAIILFTGIISLLVICICKTHFSRLPMRIQQSFRQGRTQKQTEKVVMENVIYNSKAQDPPKMTLERDAGPDLSHFQTGQTTERKRDLYATAQKYKFQTSHKERAYLSTGQETQMNSINAAAPMVPPQLFHVQLDYEQETQGQDSYSNVSHDYEEEVPVTDYVDVLTEENEYENQKKDASNVSREHELQLPDMDYDDVLAEATDYTDVAEDVQDDEDYDDVMF